MHTEIADGDGIDGLFRRLRADGRPPVIALDHPGSAAAQWAQGAGALSRLDALGEARGEVPDPLWLHDGPGVLAVADQRSALAALDPVGPPTLLTGRAALGGMPGLVTRARGPGGLSDGTPCRLEHVSAGRTGLDALREGDVYAACVLADLLADPTEQAVVAAFQAVNQIRRDDAYRAALSVPDPRWRAIALACIGLAEGRLGTVHLLLRPLLDDPGLVGAPWASFALPMLAVTGLDVPRIDGEAPWIRDVVRLEEPRSELGRLLAAGDLKGLVRIGHPLPHLIPGVVYPPRAGYDALLRAGAALRDGADPSQVLLPPPEAVGGAAKVSVLLQGRVAFLRGDRAGVRRLSASLSTVPPWPAIRVDLEPALATQGPDWELLIWTRALRGLPDASHFAERIERRIAELEARIHVLSDYVLEAELAQGAHGVVWRAVHMPTDTRVAIKLVKGAAERDVARFAREIEVAASLVHPAIASILDRGVVWEGLGAVGASAGDPFLVMELIPGGTLETVGHLDWSDVRAVTLALLDALSYAHARGVLHRDIKPANVLLADDGTIRLADFGLAGLPRRGLVAGTPAYMAPEQLRGHAVRQSDLYAMGVLVWTLVTGAPPWIGPPRALLAVDRSRLPSFEPAVPVPSGLPEVLATAMAPEPRDRFASAADFAAAIADLGEADVLPGTRSPSTERGGFALPTLLDLAVPPDADEETLDTLTLRGRSFGTDGALRWRPRLPTTGLFDAGDPPILFREAEQEALWAAWMRAVSGRSVLVEIAGPPGSGRRSLLDALRRRALRLGMPVGREPGRGPAIVEAGDEAVASFVGERWASTLVVWVRPPPGPPPPLRIELGRFTPMQVFWIVRSRIGVSGDMALDVAARSCGRPDLALAVLRDWLEDPGVAPGPAGLVPLGDTRSPRAHELAAWRVTVDALDPPRRRAWAALAGQLQGFTGAQCARGLHALGLPPVDPLDLASDLGERWLAVPAVVELLRGEAVPSDVRVVHDAGAPVMWDGADRLVDALVRDDVPALWAGVLDLDPIDAVRPALVARVLAVASRCEALDRQTWDHLQLLASPCPAWLARQAMLDGDPGFAARAWARAVQDSPTEDHPDVPTLRGLLDEVPRDGEDWLVAAWLFIQHAVWTHDLAEEALSLGPAVESHGTRGWPWWAAHSELVIGRAVHRGAGSDSLVAVARAALDAGYPGRAQRVAKLVVQHAIETGCPDQAAAARDLFVPWNPTGAVPAALHEGLSGRPEAMVPLLERGLCSLTDRPDWRGHAFLLLLGADAGAPETRWNDLRSLVRPMPSQPVAELLRQLAGRASHRPERAAVLRALAQDCDVRFV